MLSRALQKANTAVLLDNAQNFEGAMEAYGDACKLLQQVMLRSSGDDDRRKLEAIRVTYTNRIQELRLLDPAWQAAAGKTLPARPMSNESIGTDAQSLTLDNASVDEPAIIGTATITRIVNDKSLDADQDGAFRSRPARESVLTTAIREVENGGFLRDQAPAKSNGRGRTPEPGRNLGVPMDESYMPPPLSPRRPLTPNGHEERDPFKEPSVQEAMRLHPDSDLAKHGRDNSSESISWLDTIDESGGSSCSSSVHSVDNGEFRRKHLRSTSGATEAEFDAALDAAVEAAYDDHLEPFEENNPVRRFEDSSAHRRNVELAKERVREAEREAAIESARQRERENRTKQDQLPHVRGSIDSANNDPDAEEEERMLDEMTKEYMMDGFDFDLKSKSALPRQSDSSEFSSGSTWHSSMSSARNTAGTSLSTVAEGGLTLSGTSGNSSHVPASVTLPSVDETETQAPMSPTTGLVSPPRFTKLESGVRSRRLSGQNPKQLKIETSVKPASENQGPLTQQPYQLKVDESEEPLRTDDDTEGTLPSTTFKAPSAQTSQSNLQPASAAPTPGISPADSMSAISPATSLNQMMSNESAAPGSPGRSKFPGKLGQPPATIKKNKSSLSLRNRALSVSSPEGSEGTVGTPVSTTFISFGGRKASTAHSAHSHLAQTPSLPAFSMEGLGIPTGGMHLFDSDIHSPYDPGSPNPLAINGPIPLEPCPDAYLLRPFWLMRCFYQTLAHSRGGYLTSKLFIPRDIWGVKGVKIKAVEEKVANCDLLTAALLKLSSVDTYDADAVLEEMQALEAVLDQVQTNLVKKLGSDVGVNGVTNLFKDAATVSSSGTAAPDGSTMPDLPAKSAATSRSYLSSWKKLRSKNSGVGLSSTFTTKEVQKDSLTMPSLPMTSLPNIRFAKREPVQQLGAFEGPNGNYMGALARLCEAVQILDQIARQVEDPGLKHSSPTHVGLELSIRHAAEFFGFYVCRFVLQDVGMMIDKFIKRGSEWVLV
ncbi:hypothetical protein K490DRAFT_39646 [Saccharata proteae CBS 121410]|uniref:MIT domain-containing protein n=1 Tax=Saccharata proteae CBS 121410 TaxID=1314787 RepID=A0A9P4HZ16_9PEZI|nr:hypothetical protein K490DRAFT_39646 [Saccharata proteae CBS 121410]